MAFFFFLIFFEKNQIDSLGKQKVLKLFVFFFFFLVKWGDISYMLTI